jgi:VIT1/CCC1 family predicted Fe2+/Mn2+ transporter
MDPYASWHQEHRSAYLYRVCAEVEPDDRRAALFANLAGEALAQAAIWRAQLTARGHAPPPPWRPDLRTRLVAALARRLGPQRVRGVLAAMKVRGMSTYDGPLPAAGGHVPGPLRGIERRHRALASGGNLRAAMLGINDGIVSNASLMLGVAGANPNPQVVLISGVAGMCAGAFAMAAGEYVSVRSQRELLAGQVEVERDELRQYPEAEAQELALIYAAKGMPLTGARRLAREIVSDPQIALDAMAREELGLDPLQLISPWRAALAAFLSFAAGALVPLAPVLLISEAALLWPAAVTATALALFGVGACLSLYTGRNAAYAGARTLALGALAGALTFAVGWLAGAALG